jgi:hypothetical protein
MKNQSVGAMVGPISIKMQNSESASKITLYIIAILKISTQIILVKT